VNHQLGALNVPQELHAQTGAEVRAFNQAGHVGNHKGFLVRLFAHRDTPRLGSSVVKG